MARLTVFSRDQGADFRELSFSNLYSASDGEFTPTRIKLIYYSGYYDEFRGDGFRVDDSGNFTGGIVREYRQSYGDLKSTVTGINIKARDIQKAAETYSTRDDMKILRAAFDGNDDIRGSYGEDRLVGFDGDDKIRGGSKSDRLFGNDGDDAVWGNKGKDRLYGNDGDDKLIGGAGADFLLGGDGADVFRFNAGLNARNIDKIDDFIAWEDSIELDRRVFDEAGGIGTLERRAFAIGTEARDASDRIIYDDEAGALYYDADGTGAAEQVQFARLGTGLDLTADHFQIIA